MHIGVIIDSFLDHKNLRIWNGIKKIAQSKEVSLACFAGGIYSRQGGKSWKKILAAQLKTLGGLIIISENPQKIVTGLQAGLPILTIGKKAGAHPVVLADSRQGLELLEHHLKKHHQVERPGIVGFAAERDAALELEYRLSGGEGERNLFLFHPDGEPEDQKEAFLDFVRRRKGGALAGVSGKSALSAFEILKKENLKIPLITAGPGEFDLTSLAYPYGKMGETAIESMVSLINGTPIPEEIKLPCELFIQDSCGCLESQRDLIKQKGDPNAEDLTEDLKETIEENLLLGPLYTPGKEKRAALIELFHTSIKEENSSIFLDDLKKRISRSIRRGEELRGWTKGILNLFKLITPGYKSSCPKVLKLEEQALNLAASMILKEQEEHQSRFDRQTVILSEITRKAREACSPEELKSILNDKLKELDIPHFLLCLYGENKNEPAAPFVLYSRENIFRPEPGGKPPFSYVKEPCPAPIMIKPLIYQEEKLGFFLYKEEGVDFRIYDNLEIQLSHILKSFLSFKEMKGQTRELEEMVRQRTKELESANEQKTRFFINLAHEAKTPLTLVKNYLEKYIKNPGDITDLKMVQQNIDIMLRNTLNFLDAEKLKRGQVFYNHNQITNISELLKNKVRLFKELANKRKITLEHKMDNEAFLKGDPLAIDRIINNLLDNAVKYTQKTGKVSVLLEKTETGILFQVKDSGMGISREQQQKIFEPYYQLSHKKRNIQGIGMGLYIVKSICDDIDGRIEVESEPGWGTTFSITLKKYILKKEDTLREEDFEDFSLLQRDFIIKELKEVNIRPEKNNLFLVDDNIGMIYFLQSSLKERYNIFYATSGKEALRKIRSVPPPDLIISDIMMDEMDGFQFFLQISKNEEFKDIPFIFLTAKSTMDDKIKGLSIGAIDYIYKPFVIEELTAKIESVIKNKVHQKRRNIKHIEAKILNTLRMMNAFDQSPAADMNELYRKYNITRREQEVLNLALEGKINKEISSDLSISIRTVEFHIQHIYQKVGVQNRVELINFIKGHTGEK